jgi:8-oxo-dGTP pyrophosphatase MutT (NUDIX family)
MHPTAMEYEKSAGAVVFFRVAPIQYLLIRAGAWEFPKGLMDARESETAAALREVREETGLTVELLPGFRESIEYSYRHKSDHALVKKQVIYFLGEAHSQDVKISWEHLEAQWASYEQALELLKYKNAREILRRAHFRVLELA